MKMDPSTDRKSLYKTRLTLFSSFESKGLSYLAYRAAAEYCSKLTIFSDNVLEDAWKSVVKEFTGGTCFCWNRTTMRLIFAQDTM